MEKVYGKFQENSEELNKTEIAKLEKDGLRILDDIPEYAQKGFASIPKVQWDLFKWAGLTYNDQRKMVIS